MPVADAADAADNVTLLSTAATAAFSGVARIWREEGHRTTWKYNFSHT